MKTNQKNNGDSTVGHFRFQPLGTWETATSTHEQKDG